MEFVYVLMLDKIEWKDVTILSSLYEAVEASNRYPSYRVEIFGRRTDGSGYVPTYSHYKNGELILA